MKRLLVIVSFALLVTWAGNAEAARYVRCYHYGPRPLVVCGVYHRAWAPGVWRWNIRYHRYFWVPGYRY